MRDKSKTLDYREFLMAIEKKKPGPGGARPGAGRKPILSDAVRVTFDLERDEADALRELAARKGTSVSSVVRDAVRAFLKRMKRR